MRITVNILKHKWIQFLIILIGLCLIANLSRDIVRFFRALNELKLAAQKVEELQKEKESLTQKRDFYQSESFIEEEARNKLNMAKEGETLVILPPNLEEILGKKETLSAVSLPFWRQWLNLFL
jgi:cell division protein FtsB